MPDSDVGPFFGASALSRFGLMQHPKLDTRRYNYPSDLADYRILVLAVYCRPTSARPPLGSSCENASLSEEGKICTPQLQPVVVP